MDESRAVWERVEEYLVDMIVDEDEAQRQARLGDHLADLPAIEVAPNAGALLSLLARMIGARRVLEIGTLAGYSTIWLARAVGTEGAVTTLEIDPRHAEVARRNLRAAGVADRVDVVIGPAGESLGKLAEAAGEPFDLVFIDADKASIPRYLEFALRLTRPGSVIVTDNVVRSGAVADADTQDPAVQGVRRMFEMLRDDPRLDATALQTVGSKGWDGFAIALVS